MGMDRADIGDRAPVLGEESGCGRWSRRRIMDLAKCARWRTVVKNRRESVSSSIDALALAAHIDEEKRDGVMTQRAGVPGTGGGQGHVTSERTPVRTVVGEITMAPGVSDKTFKAKKSQRSRRRCRWSGSDQSVVCQSVTQRDMGARSRSRGPFANSLPQAQIVHAAQPLSVGEYRARAWVFFAALLAVSTICFARFTPQQDFFVSSQPCPCLPSPPRPTFSVVCPGIIVYANSLMIGH